MTSKFVGLHNSTRQSTKVKKTFTALKPLAPEWYVFTPPHHNAVIYAEIGG